MVIKLEDYCNKNADKLQEVLERNQPMSIETRTKVIHTLGHFTRIMRFAYIQKQATA